MRVLVANKFAFLRGGAERVMFDEIAGLQNLGHEVALFSAAHPLNEPSEWSQYFVPYIELGPVLRLSLKDRVLAAYRLFNNHEAARRFERLITDFQPDIIHIHGIHRQLSPSILRVARERSLPVVQTLHDFHHICPADTLLYAGMSPCEPRRCGKYWYGPAIVGRCHRCSVTTSALSAAETTWSRMLRLYERSVSRFVSPSAFVAERMTTGGWDLPLDMIPNAVRIPGFERVGAGTGFLYAGRLSTEKGVEHAARAAELAGVELTVAGEGPTGAQLRGACTEAKFVGRLDAEETAALIGDARAVVVPSVWFENAPMIILEAMAVGVPVIASRIGGIPEQIADGRDGLLVAPGDVGGIADAMRRLEEDSAFAIALGSEARRTVGERFSIETHLESLVRSYRDAGATP